MIFNSQRVSNDPEPYHVQETGDRLSLREWRDSYTGEFGGTVYNLARHEPRPEYDNNPNEILVAFRAAGGDKSPRGGVGDMAARVLRNELVWDLDYREPDMKDHALKVLEKLVRVYGEQGDNK